MRRDSDGTTLSEQHLPLRATAPDSLSDTGIRTTFFLSSPHTVGPACSTAARAPVSLVWFREPSAEFERSGREGGQMHKLATILCVMSVSLTAQWPNHPTPGIRRTPDGKR